MKYTFFLLSLALCLSGCGTKRQSENAGQEERPRTSVTLAHGVYGHIAQTLVFPATSVYRNRPAISAPVSGFITELHVAAGTRVSAGQLLCRMESRERHAVGGTGCDGIISICAMCGGTVLDVIRQAGDYVSEGTLLCTIAESASLVFEINVPYEQRNAVRNCSGCVLELPDGTRLQASVQQPLAVMDAASQSERLTASVSATSLPEGLHARALFTPAGRSGRPGLILPEGAVQSDESLTSHWVMKLSGDGTAVKVPVEVAGRDASRIEILSDSLSPQDAVILDGGYGLEDGAEVVVKEEAAL